MPSDYTNAFRNPFRSATEVIAKFREYQSHPRLSLLRSREDQAFRFGRAAKRDAALTLEFLEAIGLWKWGERHQWRLAGNGVASLRRVAKELFPRPTINAVEYLTTLHGVETPTASAVLHSLYPRSFPIIDWRTLYSLDPSREKPLTDSIKKKYQARARALGRWRSYVEFCRAECGALGVTVRVLDRALWMMAKSPVAPYFCRDEL